MTLILVAAEANRLFIAADHRISIAKRDGAYSTMEDNATKLMPIEGYSFPALVAFTGIAYARRPRIDVPRWLARLAFDFDDRLGFDDLLDRLAGIHEHLGNDKLRPIILVVVGFEGKRAVLATVSNVVEFERGANRVVGSFRISKYPVEGDLIAVHPFGQEGAVSKTDLEALGRLLDGAPDERIMTEMAQLVERASRSQSGGASISPWCEVGRVNPGGCQVETYNHPDDMGFVPTDTQELLERLGIKLNPALDHEGKPMPIRLEGIYTGRTPPGGASHVSVEVNPPRSRIARAPDEPPTPEKNPDPK